MKKLSKLLVACMLHSAAFALGTFEHKTFLLPHNPVHNLQLEQTLWRTHRHNPALSQTGHFQITGFYGESMNRNAIGRYFGIGNGSNSFLVGAGNEAATELDGGYLVHDRANAAASNLHGKVTLRPHQTIWGANISYRQSMSGPFAGVFFQASMPIVQIANNLGLTFENTSDVNLAPTQKYSLADFYEGSVNVEAGENAQGPLTKGKMVAGDRKTSGIADINLQIGYKLICNKDTHLDVYLRGVVPTGNRSTGEYLFEPIIGNNNHFGIGFGVDADATLWKKEEHRLTLQGNAQYTYVLEANETRLAGITTRTEDGFKYNQYVAVAAPGAPVDGSQPKLAPAINGLAEKFSVRPGSQIEMATGLGFHSGGFTVNVGYNLNWKEQEKVYRKAQDTFGDSYGIASKVQIMNARVPTYPVPANGSPFVGGMNAARGNQLYQQALGTTGGGAAVPASALQAAISGVPNNNNAVAPLTAATTGLGTDAGGAENATRLVNNSDGANGHPGVGDQPNMLAAYQAASQLYATTNLDVLGAAAAVAVAVGGGHRGRADAAVPVATQARNLIQNLQRADVSYTESNRQESMITHVFGASLGYTIEPRAGYPVMLGIGGQYDLPHSTNAGLESFKLFCKLGISF